MAFDEQLKDNETRCKQFSPNILAVNKGRKQSLLKSITTSHASPHNHMVAEK
jgi:hypothetical protein